MSDDAVRLLTSLVRTMVLLALAVLFCDRGANAAEPENADVGEKASIRKWTDKSGQYSLEAAFVDVQDGKVRLRKADGGLTVISLDRLSVPDQEYVRQREAQGSQVRPDPRSGGDASARAEFEWLFPETITPERVAQAMNEIWALAPEAASAKVLVIQSIEGHASPQGRAVAALLTAISLERSGKREVAGGAYRQLANEGRGTPYGASASFRLTLLESNAGEDAAYQGLAAQPPIEAWYLMHVSGWIWGNSRRVALNELLRIRSDSLSVRLFEWLRSCSVFPEPYAYVFVLLAISLGSTVLTLPWHIKCGRTAALVRSLLPEMERLKNLYGSDPVTYFKEVADLQRRHGIKTAPGCLIMIVQIAFTIWVLVAMRAYWPRMSLDCSRFLWVTDITQFDGWVVVLTGIVGVFLPVLMGQTRALGQPAVLIVFGGAVFSVIVWLIARHWQWPAYAFVFFLLQQVLGTTTQAVFAAVRRTAW